MTDRLDLPQRYRTILEGLLREHVPDAEVWAYGSRITGESHEGSDLDLVVRGPGLEPLGDGFFILLEAIEESNLPILVQAHDWARLPESFHCEIERDHVVIQERMTRMFLNDRRIVTLGEVAQVRSGFAFKSSDWTANGFPVVKIANIKSGSLSMDGCSYVSKITAERAAEFILRNDDILIGMTGSFVGDVAIVKEHDLPAVLNQRVGLVTILKRDVLKQKFLFYVLRWSKIRSEIEGLGYGSAQPNVSPSLLHAVEIPLPSLSEQSAIAQFLGNLDDKIELNRRMNETLEEMARTLFKSWFVDFDPVHAKATLRKHAGSGSDAHHGTIPAQGVTDGKESPGWTVKRAHAYLDKMDPSIAALFPNHFVDSELGEIPEGWEVKALGEVVELNPTEPMKRGTVAPYLDMASLPTFGSSPSTPMLREFKSGTRFRDGDTLFARITPCLENGKTAFVQVLSDDTVGWGSTEFIVLRAIPPVPPEYTYLLARDTAFREHAIQSMTGTSGRQRVQVDALAPYTLPNPPAETWNEFSILVSPLFAQMEINRKKSLALTAQRDALLPKLVSGNVRIGKCNGIMQEYDP